MAESRADRVEVAVIALRRGGAAGRPGRRGFDAVVVDEDAGAP